MTSQFIPPKKNFWLWEPLQKEASVREIWFWWEKRRIAYNAFVMILAVISAAIYVCSRIIPAGHIPSQSTSEDVVPALPLIALFIFGPILWNICYSFGPNLEIAVFKMKGVHDSSFGPVSIKIGVGFSAFIVLLPAVVGVIDSVAFSITGKKLTN